MGVFIDWQSKAMREKIIRQRDLYSMLNLTPSASMAEIRSAYRHAALHAHPDKGGSATAFHLITFAFEVLSCPSSREVYNRTCGKKTNESCSSLRAKSKKSYAVKEKINAQRGLKRSMQGSPDNEKWKQQCTSKNKEPANARLQRQRASNLLDNSLAEPSEDVPDDPGDHTAETSLKLRSSAAHCQADTTLRRLQAVLTSVTRDQRRDAILQMPLDVRKALVAYMENPQKTTMMTTRPDDNVHKTSTRAFPARNIDMRTRKYTFGTRYQAQLRIKHLRMYGSAQEDIETAIKHQMAFIQLSHAINDASGDVWNDPDTFCKLFRAVLNQHGTSDTQIGLSVFIFMRADEWIDRSRAITSPVMPLHDALVLQSKLLHARKTSWEALRAEWIPLMQRTQHARTQNLTYEKAFNLAEQSRRKFLEHRIRRLVYGVQRALRNEAESMAQKLRAQIREQCKFSREKAAQKRVALRQRRHLVTERRRWFKADLTLEEMMNGPPAHLREV